MTQLVVGTYQLQSEQVGWVLALAASQGIRAVDTALSYGNNTEIQHIITSKWSNRVFNQVTNKLCKKLGKENHTVAQDIQNIKKDYEKYKEKLAEGDFTYRVLFHHQVPVQIYIDVVSELLQSCPLIVFGVANYSIPALQELLDEIAKLPEDKQHILKPKVNQIEFHFTVNCLPVANFCKSVGVKVEAHSVLARLYRTDHPIFSTPEAISIGTPVALFLRWTRSHADLLDSVILSSRNPSHWVELMKFWNDGPLPESLRLRFDEISYNRKDGERLYPYRNLAYRRTSSPEESVFSQSPKELGNLLAADYAIYLKHQSDPSRPDANLSLISSTALKFPTLSKLSSSKWADFVVKMNEESDLGGFLSGGMRESLVGQTHNIMRKLRKTIDSLRFDREQEKKFKDKCCLIKVRKAPPNPTGSPAIVNPEPMPVEVAPAEELRPIFNLLSSGVTDSKEYEKVSFQQIPGFQATRGVLFVDGRIDMCKQVVGSRFIGDLCAAVGTGLAPVRHFLLGNNIACEEDSGALHLANLISKNLPIETFYLAGNCISSVGLSYMADAMEKLGDSSHVRALWFKRNPIKPEGAVHAARLIASSENLKVLDLDNCGLLSSGLLNLTNELNTRSSQPAFTSFGLRHLYLDANGISGASEGWKKFCESLHLLGELKTFYVSLNDLQDEGVRILSNNIDKLSKLEVLVLSSNGITDAAVDGLLSSLKKLKHLRALDLGYYKSTKDLGCRANLLTEASLPKLSEWIESSPQVEFLSIFGNNITQLEVLLDFLAQLRQKVVVQSGRKLTVDAKQAIWKQHHRLVSHDKESLQLVLHTRRVKDIASIFRNNM